ncbi:MAG: TadE family protein [Anaerovoracaceae bacterium]|nr:TadE family protein [Anaerovoracaceae bacterium]
MIRLIRFKIFSVIKNKLGSELVEATIVLPIVLLIILGMLSFLVFFFDYGISQYHTHMELIDSSNISPKFFEINSNKMKHQKEIRALSKKTYFSNKEDSIYVLNEENILRIGDAAVDLFR